MEKKDSAYPLFYAKFLCWKLKGVQPGTKGEGQKETVSMQGSRSSETVSAEAGSLLDLPPDTPRAVGSAQCHQGPQTCQLTHRLRECTF